MTNPYARAYTEVLEIVRKLPIEEYNKIPKEKIEYYKLNCDKNYNFRINHDLKNLSNEANAIIVSLYRDYFCTPKQRETLKNILANNDQKMEALKREKYNPDHLFNNQLIKEEMTKAKEPENQNKQMIEYKKPNVLVKLVNIIKKFFHK